jgi:hypothetical protein
MIFEIQNRDSFRARRFPGSGLVEPLRCGPVMRLAKPPVI